MRNTARQTRDNRTITVDFHDETTYFKLLDDRKACVEFVLAFLLALGFQLKHKAICGGGGCLTRHSHYMRVRVGTHRLAHPVHDVQSRVHHPAAFHLALSPDATRSRSRCLVGHTGWPQFCRMSWRCAREMRQWTRRRRQTSGLSLARRCAVDRRWAAAEWETASCAERSAGRGVSRELPPDFNTLSAWRHSLPESDALRPSRVGEALVDLIP
jgi:hypothetical protein